LFSLEIEKFKKKFKVYSKRCEVADESVVVMKSQPMKAGNSVEDKTEMTT